MTRRYSVAIRLGLGIGFTLGSLAAALVMPDAPVYLPVDAGTEVDR